MRFMIIGTWEPWQREEVVKKRMESGRLLPEDVTVLGEWLDVSGLRSVWLLEADSQMQFFKWSLHWSNLCKYEIFPVVEIKDDKSEHIS